MRAKSSLDLLNQADAAQAGGGGGGGDPGMDVEVHDETVPEDCARDEDIIDVSDLLLIHRIKCVQRARPVKGSLESG